METMMNKTINRILISLACGMVTFAIGCGSANGDNIKDTEPQPVIQEEPVTEPDTIQEQEPDVVKEEEVLNESSDDSDLSGNDKIYEQSINK